MKKLFACIIVFLCSFSIANIAFAESIDELLQVEFGVEAFDIETQDIDIHSFRSPVITEVYENYVAVNRILKDELVRKYAEGEFDYYQMKGIVKNHKDFVFYTNKLFYYLSIKDNGMQTKSVDTAIKRSYQNVRISFNRMKHLIAKSY